MFYTDERVQIISYDLGKNATTFDHIIANRIFTNLNEKLRLKNKYKELLKEYEILKKEKKK